MEKKIGYIDKLKALVTACYLCEQKRDFLQASSLQQKIGELIYDEAVWNGLRISDPDAGGEIKTVEV